jgi:SAM-dependent methyltransferase
VTLWDALRPLTRQLHGVVLDAGCGNGEYSRLLLSDVPTVTDVWSLDLGPQTVWGSGTLDNVRPERFVRHDLNDPLPFADGYFDCCLCWHVLEHLRNPTSSLGELVRVTKDLLAISVPRKGYGAWDSEGHRHFWTPRAFRRVLGDAGLVPVVPVLIHEDASGQNWLVRRR